MPSFLVFIAFLLFGFSSFAQAKIILQGKDKDSATIQVSTGDKYYDSGGQGGSRIPDQPGNYKNCSDPFNESTNCTSIYTLCSQGDTVAVNFIEYLIVTGDRLRIFSGKNTSGPILYNSQNQGVSVNGMKLTTGTLHKSHSPDGCITFEWFSTTIGNSIGWEADIIIYKKSMPGGSACAPVCKPLVTIELPSDTCYKVTEVSSFVDNFYAPCKFYLKLFYPEGTSDLGSVALDQSHLGQTFLYQVTDSASKAACFGYLKVNESQSPYSFCQNDTVDCLHWEKNLRGIDHIYTCSGFEYTILSTRFETMDCENHFSGLIFQSVETKDKKGLRDTCIDTLYVRALTLDSLVCPKDFKISCELLSPGIVAKDLTPNYLSVRFDLNHDNRLDFAPSVLIYPMINGQIIPDSLGACLSSIKYDDLIIAGCGSTYKIRRQWRLKSSCRGLDTVCIQNITLEDLSPPQVKNLNGFNIQLESDQCTTNVNFDLLPDIEDCNAVSQRLEFSYPDLLNPGKLIVVNSLLPFNLTIPKGGYHLVYTFADLCFNARREEVCLIINGILKPSILIDSLQSHFIDPATCWSRIYASDYLPMIRSNCCNNFLMTIAVKDSVDHYSNYLRTTLNSVCQDSDQYTFHPAWYDQQIDEWINAFVFKPYVDLSSCGSQALILRGFSLCDLPAKSESFACDKQSWYNYLMFPAFRIWANSFVPAALPCIERYPISCFSVFFKSLNDKKAEFRLGLSEELNDSTSCKGEYLRNVFESSGTSFAQIDINIIVKDTTLPTIPALPDLLIYADGAQEDSQIICCGSASCVGETYLPGSWPGAIGCNCDSSQIARFYGGPVNDDVTYDSTGIYHYRSDCSGYDQNNYVRPIYCSRYVDQDIAVSALDYDSIFYRPVFQSPGSAMEFSLGLGCDQSWTVDHKDSMTAGLCGDLTVIRYWDLASTCGQTIHFSQILSVKKRSDFEVIFPADLQLDCSGVNSFDTLGAQLAGYPFIKGLQSNSLRVTHSDSIVPDGASCLAIMRSWYILDTCLSRFSPDRVEPDIILNDTIVADPTDRYCVYRSLKDGGDGFMQYRQLIRFKDTRPPSISIGDSTIFSDNECLSPSISLNVSLSDDCTPTSGLQMTAYLDLGANESEDLLLGHETMIIVPEGLPIGHHKIKVVASDLCGNRDSSLSDLNIIDGSSPIPFCVTTPSQVFIPSSGSVLVHAQDFDAGTLPGCSGGNLKYSFSDIVEEGIATFTCDSVGVRTRTLWITNKAGYQATCQISLQVVPATLACTSSLDFSIDGKVMNSASTGISGVKITTNIINVSSTTAPTGEYSISSLNSGTNVKLIPYKDDDILNGVSTIDLLLIEKHIKGQSILTDPYLLIAADVNNSGSITVSDLISLQKIILGTSTTFPNNKSWIFIPKSFVFQDLANPWIYPQTIEYDPLVTSMKNADFIGVKVGDVNNSATVGLRGLEERSQSDISLDLRPISDGSNLEWGFYLPKKLTNLNAFAVDLKVPKGSKVLGTGLLKIVENENFYISDDHLRIVWTSVNGVTLNPAYPLFKIVTSRSACPSDFDILRRLWRSTIIADDAIFRLSLKVPDPQITIYPNPSSEKIFIKFFVNDPLHDKVFLTSTSGVIFNQFIFDLQPGENRILLNKSDLRSSGVFYFTTISNGKTYIASFIVF